MYETRATRPWRFAWIERSKRQGIGTSLFLLTDHGQTFEDTQMEKNDTEKQRAKFDQLLHEIGERGLAVKLRFEDVSDRIENVQISLNSPDFLASQLPFAIQTLRNNLRLWCHEREAIQKEIDDLRIERMGVNEQLNNLMNQRYGLQKI
jgi:hypothetical protein